MRDLNQNPARCSSGVAGSNPLTNLRSGSLTAAATMFEARLQQGELLRKIIDSIKDLVTDANFDCSATGFGLQAMDSSHVSLVALLLRADGFEHYRCDRGLSMGMNLANFAKMLKVLPSTPRHRVRTCPTRRMSGCFWLSAACQWRRIIVFPHCWTFVRKACPARLLHAGRRQAHGSVMSSGCLRHSSLAFVPGWGTPVCRHMPTHCMRELGLSPCVAHNAAGFRLVDMPMPALHSPVG